MRFKKGFVMVRKDMPPIRIPSAKDDDQPATRKMLRLVRDELRSDIRSFGHRMDSGFLEQNSRFTSMESKFTSLDSKFFSIDAQFAELRSQIMELVASVRYTNIMIEEERANRQSVVEGHQLLWQRQERMEKDWNK
jgi:hypothetical protein